MRNRSAIKIIYIINHSLPYGSNKSLLNLVDGLAEKDISPFVVMAKKGDLCNELKQRGIPYKIIPHQFSIYPYISRKRLRNYVSFIPKLLSLIVQNLIAVISLIKVTREFDADIIHTNIGPDHIGYMAARIMGIPHVWHIREYQDLHFKWHPIPCKAGFVRKLHCTNNYPIAISHGLYKHYKMQVKGRVIYNGILKSTQIQFINKKKRYFLFVGCLEKTKGIRQLIETFIELAKYETTYSLYIAGDGSNVFAAELHRIVDKSGFSQRIKFLGFQSDIYDLMANATALIVPSFYEGFGRITAEAMFNGCLVIGNNSGGTKEILEKENLGILYSGHEELLTAIKMVVSNGIESYYPTVKKAQERAVDLYSIEQNVSAVYDLYQEILSIKQINVLK
jgi:glycosyltransferase involved in cell wall biosynthesis